VVFGVKLVKFEVNDPVPVPSEVLVDREMGGLVFVDQTTPLAVIEDPPAAVIFPPEVAEVVVIAVMAVVVSVGMETMENVSFKQRIEIPVALKAPKPL